MRMISFDCAFRAVSFAAVALLAHAGSAHAQSVGLEPPSVAAYPADDTPAHGESAFTLIEHKAPRRAIGMARAEPAPQSALLPGSLWPSNGDIDRRPVSSSARDRVIVHIKAAEIRHGLPAGLLDALVAAESGYRPDAVSKAGAAGLAQLMPATARALGVIDRFDIRANLDGGARYLRAMIDKFTSISTALAAYNSGPGAVIRARGIPRNGETPNYVERVLRHWRPLLR